MDTKTLREKFLGYFESNQHSRVASASLIPVEDPTLLFVNAGMVPFKDVFLGEEKRGYTRATSSQRCIRAGGKHNDLDNVGFTARHHTFFEMLGNFSFGDYFKKEAISFAWNFLTVELKIPAEKLWVTVFEEDSEAEEIWLKDMGVSQDRFSRIGAKDNFWSMGDTGPCGPCTEIFYDHGADIAGGPPGTPEEDGDRYIEIWNLVFMQYNRDKSGELTPLPSPCVDTGMGLERIAAVMQNVHDNYDIDLFQILIKAIAQIAGTEDLQNRSLRVIADHIRSTAFLILDGIVPSNEGRGYVLRRIMRRALRHGHKLGISDSFFFELVEPLCKAMGEAYPNLVATQSQIADVILEEEKQFARTLSNGVKEFESALKKIKDKTLPGDVVFKLYDTYGFPVDLTEDMAKERGFKIDHAGFEIAMNEQRSRARAASHFAVDYNDKLAVSGKTEFTGYEHVLCENAEVVSLFVEGKPAQSMSSGDSGVVVLSHSPFYAESGGQVGDTGELAFAGGVFTVSDTQKQGDVILHIGDLKSGELKAGITVEAHINAEARESIKANHSATHLLHAALRQVLGDHVTQKGSLVNADRLRFDFSNPKGVPFAKLREVEQIVNAQIRANHEVSVTETSPDKAKDMGAMALFGEKYGDVVRVLKMGEFSIELCGGTHVARTGDIGLFKILSEAGVASGVRRIEACSGVGALTAMYHMEDNLIDAGNQLKSSPAQVSVKVGQLIEKTRGLQKQLTEFEGKLASNSSQDLVSQVEEINGVKTLITKVDMDPKGLRDLLDSLKKELTSAVIVLAVVKGDRITLISGVTDDLTGKYHAGNIIKHVAEQVGGKGGGRADMAQAGGNIVGKLDESLNSVKTLL